MNKLLPTLTGGVTLVSAQATAVTSVFPPLRGGDVVVAGSSWIHVPEFDIEFSADGACNLSAAELLGAVPEALVVADDTFTAAATDICTATAHGLQTGDGPVQLTTTDTLPAGLALLTDYWIIRIDANTFYFASSRANALAGTAVDITDTGTGTHTLSDTTETERLRWSSHGLIGQAQDGVIALTATKNKTQRFRHRPRVEAYAILATLSGNNLTAKAFPVLEN